MTDFFPPQQDIDKLLAYCKKICWGSHDDLFQDTILRFLENRHRLAEYRYQLLTVIARNLFIDGYRKQKVRPSVTHEFPEISYTDHEVESVDFDRLIMDAIEGIGEGRHQAVLRLWIAGKSYEEIKDELALCSRGAVAGALSSARRKVREGIKEAAV